MKKLAIIVTVVSLVFLISCGKESTKKIPTPTTPIATPVIPENESTDEPNQATNNNNTQDNPNQPTNNNNTQLVPKVITISFTDTKYAIAELYLNPDAKGVASLHKQEQNDSAISAGSMVKMTCKNIMGTPVSTIHSKITDISYFDKEIYDKDTLDYLNNKARSSKVFTKEPILPDETVILAFSNPILVYDTKRKPSKADHIAYKLQKNIKKYLLMNADQKLFPENSIYKYLKVYKKVEDISRALKNIKSVTYEITFDFDDGTSSVYTKVQDYKKAEVILNFVEIFDLSVKKDNTNEYGISKGEYTIFRNQFVDDIKVGSVTIGKGE